MTDCHSANRWCNVDGQWCINDGQLWTAICPLCHDSARLSGVRMLGSHKKFHSSTLTDVVHLFCVPRRWLRRRPPYLPKATRNSQSLAWSIPQLLLGWSLLSICCCPHGQRFNSNKSSGVNCCEFVSTNFYSDFAVAACRQLSVIWSWTCNGFAVPCHFLP